VQDRRRKTMFRRRIEAEGGLATSDIRMSLGDRDLELWARDSLAGTLPPRPSSSYNPEPGPYGDDRKRMIQSGIVGWAIEDPAAIEGMGQIRHHRFVTEEFLDEAVDNHPLPIGCR
jgi:hypothetical protein